MNIEDCYPGLPVVYRPHAYAEGEDGEVVRVNDSQTLVFVRYHGSPTPKATSPHDLTPLVGKR